MSMFWNWISNQFANVFHRNEWITKSSNESNECWVYYEINLSKTLSNNHNEKKQTHWQWKKIRFYFAYFYSMFHCSIKYTRSCRWNGGFAKIKEPELRCSIMTRNFWRVKLWPTEYKFELGSANTMHGYRASGKYGTRLICFIAF